MEHPIFSLLKEKFLSPKVAITFTGDSIWVSADKKKHSFHNALRLRSSDHAHDLNRAGEARYMLFHDDSIPKTGQITSYLVVARIDVNVNGLETAIRVAIDGSCDLLDLCDPNSIDLLVKSIAKQIEDE